MEKGVGPAEALVNIHRLVASLKEWQKLTPTRATALAITKLEEAAMWLDHTDSAETHI